MTNLSRFLDDYTFGITLNLNDVFYPAADSEFVDVSNITPLMHLEKLFGFEGVYAFVIVKRNITDLSFYKHKRKVNQLDYAIEKVHSLIADKKIDTFDWGSGINKKLYEMGLIPEESELTDWFHQK